MQFNFFGLQASDVANYLFASLADFSGSSSTSAGQAFVEAEMEMAEAVIVNSLNKNVIESLQKLYYVQVELTTANQIVLPISGSISDFYRRADIEYTNQISNQNILGGCTSKNCTNNLVAQLSSVTFTLSAGNYYSSENDPTYNYYADIIPDVSSLDIPDLKMLLRDIVCCSLGAALDTREGEEWKLVTRCCDRSEKMLEMIAGDSYFPAALKSLDYLVSPIAQKSQIYTVRSNRA